MFGLGDLVGGGGRGVVGVVGGAEFEDEAGAGGDIFFGADGAVVLLHDLGGDGEAEAGAALLGGIERQKQPLADFIGEAVAALATP